MPFYIPTRDPSPMFHDAVARTFAADAKSSPLHAAEYDGRRALVAFGVHDVLHEPSVLGSDVYRQLVMAALVDIPDTRVVVAHLTTRNDGSKAAVRYIYSKPQLMRIGVAALSDGGWQDTYASDSAMVGTSSLNDMHNGLDLLSDPRVHYPARNPRARDYLASVVSHRGEVEFNDSDPDAIFAPQRMFVDPLFYEAARQILHGDQPVTQLSARPEAV